MTPPEIHAAARLLLEQVKLDRAAPYWIDRDDHLNAAESWLSSVADWSEHAVDDRAAGGEQAWLVAVGRILGGPWQAATISALEDHVADLTGAARLLEEIREKAREWVGAHDGGSWPPWACLALGVPVDVAERRAYLADRFPCGHVGIVVRGCGGCDPSAIGLVLDEPAVRRLADVHAASERAAQRQALLRDASRYADEGDQPNAAAARRQAAALDPAAEWLPQPHGQILAAFWIHGPCPGCDDWSLQVDADAFLAAGEVEAALAEHRAECPGLDAIATERGIE